MSTEQQTQTKTMSTEQQTFDLGLEIGTESVQVSKMTGKVKSVQERVLESFKKEIEELDKRTSLELVTREYLDMNGIKKIKTENRFWKNDPRDKDKLLVSIKVGGRTFPHTTMTYDSSKPQYIPVEKNKKSLMKRLVEMRDTLGKLSPEHILFTNFKNMELESLKRRGNKKSQ